jgi:hypothetical protein
MAPGSIHQQMCVRRRVSSWSLVNRTFYNSGSETDNSHGFSSRRASPVGASISTGPRRLSIEN